MTVNYTTLLRLVQPVTGTESGTWGDYVNNAFSSYVDAAIAGTQTINSDAPSGVSLTLTEGTNAATNLGTTSAQYAILNLIGSRTAIRTVTLPTTSRHYIVLNNTSGGYAVTVGGVSVANGERCILTYDTNASAYVKVATHSVSNATGTLPAANGGTGITSPGTSGNFLISNGTAWTSSALSANTVGGVQFFSADGTFTVPDYVTRVKVTVVAGGGRGGTVTGFGAAGGGGGGGCAMEVVTGLTPGGTVSVTVGAGGTSGTPTGGNSSFGAYVSATGGAAGGNTSNSNSGGAAGAGGTGSGGDINGTASNGVAGRVVVGTGCDPNLYYGGAGGTQNPAALSYGVSGAGGSWSSASGNGGQVGSAAAGKGGGGGGGAANSGGAAGADGSSGFVLVEW